jgi:hypothetical protein
MADPVRVDGCITRLASVRKTTKDGTETIVTLALQLHSPSEDDVAALLEVQGRDEVRVTFSALQGVLPLSKRG